MFNSLSTISEMQLSMSLLFQSRTKGDRQMSWQMGLQDKG